MTDDTTDMTRNVALFPWFRFFQSLLFWQATWFLYFQNELSASEAILLYAVFDLSVTVLEVPSGYMSDRIGRRFTLIMSSLAFLLGLALLSFGGSFAVFIAGQMLLGAGSAFNSGTDTALLYQSLVASGRKSEMEAQTLRAWRVGFSALAVSAVIGGTVALWSDRAPFVLSALAMCALFGIALQFREPPRDGDDISEAMRVRQLMESLRKPVLMWIFALGVVMYGFSHIPFVFGQPFIAEALEPTGLAESAPLVSGTITALMMGLSLLVSLIAPSLRARLGLGVLLLCAFGIQIGLAGLLALSGSVLVIAVLLLRMVPDSLSTPFIIAHLQPLLEDDTRATFLSIKSLAGRVAFAASLWLASANTSAVDEMPLSDVQSILGWYALVGIGLLVALGIAASRIRLES